MKSASELVVVSLSRCLFSGTWVASTSVVDVVVVGSASRCRTTLLMRLDALGHLRHHHHGASKHPRTDASVGRAPTDNVLAHNSATQRDTTTGIVANNRRSKINGAIRTRSCSPLNIERRNRVSRAL